MRSPRPVSGRNSGGDWGIGAALLGSVYDKGEWKELLQPRFRRAGAYFIPHAAFDWTQQAGARFVPEGEPVVDGPAGWHPEDELFAHLGRCEQQWHQGRGRHHARGFAATYRRSDRVFHQRHARRPRCASPRASGGAYATPPSPAWSRGVAARLLAAFADDLDRVDADLSLHRDSGRTRLRQGPDPTDRRDEDVAASCRCRRMAWSSSGRSSTLWQWTR